MKIFNKKDKIEMSHNKNKDLYIVSRDFSGNMMPYINFIQISNSKR